MRKDEAPIVANVGDGRKSWNELGVYSGKSIWQEIEAHSRRVGDDEFVYLTATDRHAIKMSALVDKSRTISQALAALGLQPGDRMAVMMPHSEESILLYLAAMSIGVAVIPIVAIYGTGEVEFILRDSDARVLFCPDKTRKKEYAPIIAHCQAAGLLDTVVVVGDEAIEGTIGWNAFAAGAKPFTPARAVSGDDLSFIIYTSGTTSRPKGVRHTHNTLNFEFASKPWEREGPQRTIANMPAGHMAGLLQVMCPFYWGGTVFFLEEWDATAAAQTISANGVTSSGGTPFHFNQVMDAAERLGLDLHSVKMWVSGATVVPQSVVRRGEEYGIAVCRCYGSTEHPTISQNFASDPREKRITTDGQIMPNVLVRIVNDDGEDLPLGESGHILSRGPDLFVGYTDEDANRASFIDGWFRTGDVGRVDEQGYLAITDRHKDIVIRGGENISASEVEETLRTHPAIRDAAVVPYPDAMLGERVCAFIVLREGHAITLEETLAHFVANGLAKQKSPERLIPIDVLPRSAIGKVDKTSLKAQVRRDAAA